METLLVKLNRPLNHHEVMVFPHHHQVVFNHLKMVQAQLHLKHLVLPTVQISNTNRNNNNRPRPHLPFSMPVATTH